MRNKKIFDQILKGVCSGEIKEPFSPKDLKTILGPSKNFLHKHRIGNGRDTELFKRAGRGEYYINPTLKICP
jgi:hypothetical protein